MAWSDAARAAALEVRRAHRNARGSKDNANIRKSIFKYKDGRVPKTGPRTMWDVMSSRQKIAADLRGLRAGRKSIVGLSGKRVAHVAVLSTRYRNLIRMLKK